MAKRRVGRFYDDFTCTLAKLVKKRKVLKNSDNELLKVHRDQSRIRIVFTFKTEDIKGETKQSDVNDFSIQRVASLSRENF